LLFAIIAYRVQADRFGDLDYATRQVLDRTIAKEAGSTMSSRLISFDQKRTKLTPGTVLVLPGTARPMTAFPRSLSPSPARSGTGRASLD
jgi:hypothetical protein